MVGSKSSIRGSLILDDKYITSMSISDTIVLHSDKNKSSLPFEKIKQVSGVLNMPVVYEGRTIDLDKVKLVEGDYVLDTRQYYIEILFNDLDDGEIWESHHIYAVKKADENGIMVTTKFGTNLIVGRGLDLLVEDKAKISIFGKEDEVLAEFNRVMREWLDSKYNCIWESIRGMLDELKR